MTVKIVERDLVFYCSECKFREVIEIEYDSEFDLMEYLENNTTSSGCHIGCGTKQWMVWNNGYLIV